MIPKTPVLYSHDGGIDDLLCVILLTTMAHVEPLGIVVTPADCYIEPAVAATRKILDLLGRSEIVTAESTVRGVNPFPREFRKSSWMADNLPILNRQAGISAPLADETGQEFVVRLLSEATKPVVYLETGPLTTLAEALRLAPEIAPKIEKVVWMGGALNVPGNVSPFIDANVDGSQEWNVYWDPFAADAIWQTGISLTLCPLDLTNHVPLTAEFMARLAANAHHPVSDLAGQLYALVHFQPYYFWDVLTTAFLGRPDLFTLREWETSVVTRGPQAGRTVVTPGGRLITALDTVDVEGFYAYIVEAWAR